MTANAETSTSDPMRRRRIVLVVVALFATAAVVALAVLAWVGRSDAAREAARVDALAAAPSLVETVLSYNSPTVDADLAEAAAVTTGDFRGRFTEYATKTVAPQSKTDGTSTRARVVDVGYLDGTADHVRVLAFVNQITTSTTRPAPASAGSRIEVGLDLVDGEWRIGELTPI